MTTTASLSKFPNTRGFNIQIISGVQLLDSVDMSSNTRGAMMQLFPHRRLDIAEW